MARGVRERASSCIVDYCKRIELAFSGTKTGLIDAALQVPYPYSFLHERESGEDGG